MINRVVICGRLVRDPELKKTPSDSSVVTFTVAVDNRPKANNVAKYTKKGSLVGVDGRLNQRQYQSKDGRTVNVVEVIADTVQFLEKKSDGSTPAIQDEPVESIDTTDDMLPF